jgi:uncharacterized protein
VASDTSRRSFIAAGLALPAAGLASTTASPAPLAPAAPQAASTTGKLAYRTLGKTGLKVTTVGYGCMITSDPSVIARAADMGINYFDSARGYANGQNERMVGAALGARRKNVFLSSKCETREKASVLAELDTSLREFNTDHLDVWLLHIIDDPALISDDLVDALHIAKQQGKARFVGVSTHQLPAVINRILETKLDVVQVQYNHASAAEWGPALDKLNQAGVGLVAMKVMARVGAFRGPGPGGDRRGGPPPMAGGDRRGGPPPMPGGERGAAPPRAPLAPEVAAAAIKWVLKNPAIATTVSSMTDIDQLEQNFSVMAQPPFTAADQKLLAARLPSVSPYFCRSCGQCKGQCPKGLPVSDLVRYVMYADGYGEFPLGRENYLRMSREHREARCADCVTCAVQCPHGVRVAEQSMRAQELFA